MYHKKRERKLTIKKEDNCIRPDSHIVIMDKAEKIIEGARFSISYETALEIIKIEALERIADILSHISAMRTDG